MNISALMGLALVANAAIIPPVSTSTNVYAEARAREEFKEIPALLDVAFCESTLRHYDKDGNVLRGREVKADIGLMQINETFHREAAEKLGLNIDLVDDNIAYAKVLYLKNGLRDWKASWPCLQERAKLRQNN